jgi:hypothetical protein
MASKFPSKRRTATEWETRIGEPIDYRTVVHYGGALFAKKWCRFWINPDNPYDYREVSEEEHWHMLNNEPHRQKEYVLTNTLRPLGGHPDNLTLTPDADIARWKENERWLDALNAAGVENWEGFDYAMRLFQESNNEND